ncbi:MAG: hypothetical protein ABSF15_29275 [Candidatus Sulfotelmatobacter sp.]|jgi:hypothetical protein
MSKPVHQLDLPALDGANPLGFLAALGTLAVLSETDPKIKLGWHSRARWTPFLTSHNPLEESEVMQRLATRLRGKPVDTEKEKLRDAAQRRFAAAKTELKNAEKRFKERGLRRKEKDAEREKEVAPYEDAFAAARTERLAALKDAVPSPELALGDKPDCTIEEFRQHALAIRAQSKPADRNAADLVASFGAELSADNDESIEPTPFCFVNGSGKQWFLATVRQLMTCKDPTKQEPSPPPCVTEANLRNCIFNHWAYSDEGLSMRWDPAEDVRYALRLDNPGPIGAYTVWMANLIAYVALACFPCAPVERGSATACWPLGKKSPSFRWPVWETPLTLDSIRSILTHPALAARDYESDRRPLRAELRARGIAAIFSAHRIQVGNPPLHKINFSPAFAL